MFEQRMQQYTNRSVTQQKTFLKFLYRARGSRKRSTQVYARQLKADEHAGRATRGGMMVSRACGCVDGRTTNASVGESCVTTIRWACGVAAYNMLRCRERTRDTCDACAWVWLGKQHKRRGITRELVYAKNSPNAEGHMLKDKG